MKIWRAHRSKCLSALRSRKVPVLDSAAAIAVPTLVSILAAQQTREIGAFAEVLVSGGESIGARLRVLTPAETARLSAQLERTPLDEVADALAATDLRPTVFAGQPVPPSAQIRMHLTGVEAHLRAAVLARQGLIIDLAS